MNIANAMIASNAPGAADRASDAWRRICDKPSEIVLKRVSKPGTSTTLDAQTMRVEHDSSTANDRSPQGMGASSQQKVVLFGIQGHCNEPDTDIQRGDQFALDGTFYRVVAINRRIIGEVQASAEAQQ